MLPEKQCPKILIYADKFLDQESKFLLDHECESLRVYL